MVVDGLDGRCFRIRALDEEVHQTAIFLLHKERTGRWCTVTSGATGLLVIGLERERIVGMDHMANVGLVYAHTEGIGRNQDLDLPIKESVLYVATDSIGQTGVIGLGPQTSALKIVGEGLDALSGAAVDDHGVVGRRPCQLRDVLDLEGRIYNAER